MSVTVKNAVVASELAYAARVLKDAAPTLEVTVDAELSVDMKTGDVEDRLAVYKALFGEESAIVGAGDAFVNKAIVDGLKTWGKLSKRQNVAEDPFNKLRAVLGKIGTMAMKTPFLAGHTATVLDVMFYAMLKPRYAAFTKEEMLSSPDCSRWFNFMQHFFAEEVATVPMDAPKPKKKAPAQQKGDQKKGGKGNQPAKAIDVSRVDIRVGQLVEVGNHPDADALYAAKVDVGEESGPRDVCMGLRKFVPVEELQGRKVAVVCNLKPVNMRGIKSCAMIMAASNADHTEVKMVSVPDVALGTRITATGFEGAPDAKLTGKKKVWPTVQADLKSNAEGVCCYKDLPLLADGKPLTTEMVTASLG